jgi:hypothetical protein
MQTRTQVEFIQVIVICHYITFCGNLSALNAKINAPCMRRDKPSSGMHSEFFSQKHVFVIGHVNRHDFLIDCRSQMLALSVHG